MSKGYKSKMEHIQSSRSTTPWVVLEVSLPIPKVLRVGRAQVGSFGVILFHDKTTTMY